MSWSRRDLLVGAGAATAATATLGVVGAQVLGHEGGDDFDPEDWSSVRAQFPLSTNLRHFAAYVLAAHPRPVARAIERYRRKLDADTEAALDELGQLEGTSRQAAADYLGVSSEEIALTQSTTMGLGIVYGGLRLGAGDEVVTTEHDFFSTYEALRLRAARDDVTVRRVRLYDDGAASEATEGDLVTRLVGAVTPATRAMAVTWVHSSTGLKLPVQAIADALADVNAGRDDAERVLLCVDGVHGFGIEADSPADLRCDFLVSGTHKWLFGPRGTGLIWGRSTAWDRMAPSIPSFNSASFEGWRTRRDPTGTVAGEMASPGGYHAFEHRWALEKAFQFHMAIGKAAIHERTRTQATALKEGLAELDGVEVITPMDPELSSGIVCADVTGRPPFELVTALREQHDIIASVSPYDPPYLRFGPSIVTTPDEVDEVIEAVAALV